MVLVLSGFQTTSLWLHRSTPFSGLKITLTRFFRFVRAPSVRISRRIKVPSDSISESTGVLNIPNSPNGQVGGDITPNEETELKRFETSVFPPSPPPDESITSFEMPDGPPATNHVGPDVSPSNEVGRNSRPKITFFRLSVYWDKRK